MAMYSCPVIITGDVNIYLDDAGDYNARKLVELIQSFGFTQHVDVPTQRYGHTLDVVASKSDLPAPIIEVRPPGEISDHSLILFQLPLPKPPLHYINVSTRAWRGFKGMNSGSNCYVASSAHQLRPTWVSRSTNYRICTMPRCANFSINMHRRAALVDASVH